MPTTFRGLASLLLLCCLALSTRAQLSTSLLHRSGMVLQRQVDIPLWGQAEAGAPVHAWLNGLKDSTTTGPDGTWEMVLPAMDAGGPYELILYSDVDSLLYTDVYLGDVWLASGQSNMAMELKDCDDAAAVINSSDEQEIRQFLVTKSLGSYPREELPAGSAWTPATPDYAGAFSGVGYYFAKHLYSHMEIPMGIINASFGGTRIESWMSEAMLGYDEQDLKFGEGESYLQPTLAYNHMLHPLLRFPIKGVLWYQGESNMGSRENALMYTGQLKKLINSWRELWGLGDLPFLWVQLPNTGSEANESSPGTWDALPMLRAATSRVLAVPNTGEAITIDTGEPDIHPTNKEPVGERLALVARSVAYGDSLVYSGPRYKGLRILENGRIEISFDHDGEGLVAWETGDQSLRWFALAGSNGTFYQASARIDSNRVVVWNPGIPNPEYIRYAWESNPYNVNFYNAEGLPAAPFQIRVHPPGLHIQSFRSTDYALDKGESALLTWQVYGSDQVLLNQLEMDSIGGIRIWPESDTVFTLRAVSREQAGPPSADSATVRIYVQEPDPLISISTDAGQYIALGSEVHIRAEVGAPDGGSVEGGLVEFLVNDSVIGSINQPPFECTWTPETAGRYLIYGIVTNHRGMSAISDTLRKEVDAYTILKFEAEDAAISGRYYIQEDDIVSMGLYADLNRDWTLSFDSIAMYEEGTFQLTMAYMLNYGSPKIQDLYLNGDYFSSLVFESPDEDLWSRHHALIPMNQGNNQLSIKSNWGPMSIDYISLLVRNTGSLPLGKGADLSGYENLRIYPNPTPGNTRISFYLPEAGPLALELFDLSGQKKAELLQGIYMPGRHEISFRTNHLRAGIYFLHFGYKSKKTVRKMIVL